MKENFALGKVVVNHHALYHGLPRGQCGGQDKKKKKVLQSRKISDQSCGVLSLFWME